jgi:hypothetical protein
MREKWKKWMIEGQKQLTKAGNLKRPEISTVCQWVIDSWGEIPKEMVMYGVPLGPAQFRPVALRAKS